MEKIFNKNLKRSVAFLHFEDGTKFKGFVNREANDSQLQLGIWGESAFTTGMSGYEETITDPSFLGQHIIFTNAHIGNYQANPNINVAQAKKSFATSIIARNFSYNDCLNNLDIPLFSGVDTRSLVRYLTSKKVTSHKSVLTFKETTPSLFEFSAARLITDDLHLVSQTGPVIHRDGLNPIVVLNYGIKQAIIDQLHSLGLPLVSLPNNASTKDVLALNPRLIFLSNGPGDPRNYLSEISVVRELLQSKIPMRAICLGIQLIARALDIEVEKLPYGQRGANHPVIDHTKNKVAIT